MKSHRFYFVLALYLLFLTIPAFAKSPILTAYGTVTKVSDGDTVHVVTDNTKLRVRLYGIDAPETAKINKKTGKENKPGQPFGDEAYKALKGKIDGRKVKLVVMDKDRYKRMVGIIYLDDREINKEMVTEGLAWAYRQYLDRPHASEYIPIEERARKEKRGLWKQSNPQPPWEFRKFLRKHKNSQDYSWHQIGASVR